MWRQCPLASGSQIYCELAQHRARGLGRRGNAWLPPCSASALPWHVWQNPEVTFLERWKVKGQSIQHRLNKISSWKQRKGQLWNGKARTKPPQYFLIILGQLWPTECAIKAQELLLRAGGTEQHCSMHSVSADGFLNLLFTAVWLEGQHKLLWQDGSDRGRLTSRATSLHKI